MSGRHQSADRQRAHAAGQRKIKHWCDCGRQLVGNAAWASHIRANPDHKATASRTWPKGQPDA